MENKKTIVILGIVGLLGVTILISLLLFWAQRGNAVSLTNQIEAQHKTNQSEYDNMWKKFKEMTQVTELQAQQVKEVYQDLIAGRYEGDENLAVKSIVESNPNFDTNLYQALSNQIAADRTNFSNNQKKVIDKINIYNTYIEHEAVFMAMIFNFKKINTDDYVLISKKTKNAYENLEDDEIKLN